MAKDFVPRPYQELMIDHALATPRCALWAGMGMGKTSASLAVVSAITELEGGKTLAIAPLRVAGKTWPNEANKWRQFQHLEVSPIIGTEAERHRALVRDAAVYTINYENVPWLLEWCNKELKRWPFHRVIADEATRLKNFRLRGGGRRAFALGRIAHTHVQRFIELTGTPSPNGLRDLWGQAWFLDEGKRLGRTLEAFDSRWFSMGFDGTWKPHQFAQAQIQDALRDLCVTLDPKDWFDLKEPIVRDVWVDLPPKARGLYRDMERRLFAELEGDTITAQTGAVKSIKCLQIANGAAYVDLDDAADEQGPRRWIDVHDEKLQALESVHEEAGGAPLLVAYQFRSDKARIMHAFPKAIDITTDEGLDQALAGKGTMWLAHPASMGHGIDGLQEHCNMVAFFGNWWNLEEYQQIIERVGPVRQAQAGRDVPVWVWHIYARDTVDELVDLRRRMKAEVQHILLNAMKRSRA